MSFNGVPSEGYVDTAFCENNRQVSNVVGDTYMQFRGTLEAGGCGQNGSQTYPVSFNAGTASGSDGNQYTGINHQVSTERGTNWL